MSETPRQVFMAMFDQEYDPECITTDEERAADLAKWLARFDEAQASRACPCEWFVAKSEVTIMEPPKP
jgi:hypothetical protein